MNNTLLLFIKTIEKSQDNFVAIGLCLSETRFSESRLEQWTAYLPDKQQPPILVQKHYIDWIGSGIDAGGHHVTFFDGQDYIADPDRDVREIAQNLAEVIIHQEIRNSESPFFLSTDKQVSQAKYDCVIDLNVKTFADLPDVEAYINSCEEAESNSRNADEKSVDLTYSAKIRSTAYNMIIETGVILPVSFLIADQEIYGVLYLQQKLKENEFQSTLYVNSNENLPPSVQLKRNIKFHKFSETISRSVVLGTLHNCVLSIK